MKKNKIILAVAAILLLIVGALGVRVFGEVGGWFKKSETAAISIQQGDTPAVIAQKLKEADIIGSEFIFKAYVKITGAGAKFQYGDFELLKDASYKSLVTELETIKVTRETVTITFPEGTTIVQFAKRIEEAGICTAQQFYDALENGDYTEFEFTKQVSDNRLKFMKYEGFLYPDTYNFFKDETPENVVRKLFATFEKRITPEMYTRMDELDMTLEQVIILASIINEEAGDPANMAPVSGVLHNRLAPGSPHPKLECDVSYYYIKDFIEPTLGHVSDEMFNAYYTYECIGLPVGALSNPGIEAINAALYPQQSDYYFFVTDKTGKYWYAKTFEEHVANIAETKKVNARVGA